MRIKLGTFNLNNLFSRFNFAVEVDAIKKADATVDSKVLYKFTKDDMYRLRTFKGKLVKGKPAAGRAATAARIKRMDCDVLAVQEVEDIDTLKRFLHDDLKGLYKHYVLIEGNDPRLIDVAVISKLPLGAVTSWHQMPHPAAPKKPVFGRDLLQVEVWDATRARPLLTLFNTHLKSHLDDDDDGGRGKLANDRRRTQQAEVMRDIFKTVMKPSDPYVVVGDMNDPPDSSCIAPFAARLANALEHPTETRPAKPDTPNPPSPAWTHRFMRAGKAAHHLFDHIWLSAPLADRLVKAEIDRRTKHGGDGSDHDPAFVTLEV